jgi:glycosyltransferase involved in cell wall biosynthesis
MKSYSIVIPCFNEAKNIEKLVTLCLAELCGKGIEVVIINNGSTDNTNDILHKMNINNSYLKIYKLNKNIGYGGGILYGLKKAKGDYIGWTHADLQTDPKDVERGFGLIDSSTTFVKGSRQGRPFFDNVFSIGMAIFECLILRKIFWEINAQPTLFSKEFFESWDDAPKDFSLDLYAYAMAKNNKLSIKRFKVLFPDRIYGQSSWNSGFVSKLLLIKRTIKFSFSLRKKISSYK